MSDRRIVQVLKGVRADPPPMWLMRQAGRYLPEYRALRAQSPDFISFCLNPEAAAEATLQPIRRFDLDAAIVFADILLLPFAAGQHVRFETGEGPRLAPVASRAEVDALDWDGAAHGLEPVSDTLARVRADLPDAVGLIGFAGAPWTVATYMIGGGKDPNRWAARVAAWRDPEFVDHLLARLSAATADYLVAQARAGADVLKIFDSWTDGLPAPLFERVSIAPTRDIVARVRAAGVSAPIIGFPRGSGGLVARYQAQTGVDAVALDMSQLDPSIVGLLPAGAPVQGGLDPALLAAGGPALAAETNRILAATSDRPYVFNLGHGIAPDTPPEHVGALVRLVKGEG